MVNQGKAIPQEGRTDEGATGEQSREGNLFGTGDGQRSMKQQILNERMENGVKRNIGSIYRSIENNWFLNGGGRRPFWAHIYWKNIRRHEP